MVRVTTFRKFLAALCLLALIGANVHTELQRFAAPEAEAQAATFTLGTTDAVRAFANAHGANIPTAFNGAGMVRLDITTATKLCNLAGYTTVAGTACTHPGENRCNYTSCGDNSLHYWNGAGWVGTSSCGGQWLAQLVCTNPIQVAQPKLKVDKQVAGQVNAGGQVTYTYVISNIGAGNAAGVNLIDYFFANGDPLQRMNAPFQFVGSNGANCGWRPGEKDFLCQIGALNAGASKTITMTFNIPANQFCNQQIMNQADVHLASGPSDGISDWDKVATTVKCAATPQCRDGIDNDGDGKIDFVCPGGATQQNNVTAHFQGNQGPWEDVAPHGDAKAPTFVGNVQAGGQVRLISANGTYSARIYHGRDELPLHCSAGTLSFTNNANQTIYKVRMDQMGNGVTVPAGATKVYVSHDEPGARNYFDNSGNRDSRPPCAVTLSIGTTAPACLPDPSCSSPDDDSENDQLPQCADGIDNDGDGATDLADFSCSGPNDNDEANPKAQCQDGADNDGDGKVDFPNDPGCASRQDNDEFNAPVPQCEDGIDNDGDGKVDMNDPGCSNPDDNSENDEPQCSDGRDNDNDGKIDFPQDPGCFDAADNNEFNEPTHPLPNNQCQDGIDNDGDGLRDYPQDPGCSSKQDNDETNGNEQCQNGKDDDGDNGIDFNGGWKVTSFNSVNFGSTGPFLDCPGKTAAECAAWWADTSRPNGRTGPTLALSSLQAGQIVRFETSGTINYGTHTPGLLSSCRDGLSQEYTQHAHEIGIAQFTNDAGQVINPGIPTPDNKSAILLRDFTGGITVPAGATKLWVTHAEGYYLDNAGTCTISNVQVLTKVARDNQCTSPTDNSEGEEAQCSDGIDNDGDGKIDMQDPGCSNPDDNNEGDNPQCSDNIDNDGDGLKDFPNDPGCTSPNDNDEHNAPLNTTLTIEKTTTQTSVGRNEPVIYTITVRNTGNQTAQNVKIIDNVPFNLSYVVAGSTAGCIQQNVNGVQQVQCAPFDLPAGQSKIVALKFMVNANASCNSVLRNQADAEAANAPLVWDDVTNTITCPTQNQCQDGFDNDADGKIDFPQDPGCTSPTDDSETDNQLPQCSDGIDNDQDGRIDMNDPGCSNPNDNNEGDEPQCRNNKDDDGDGKVDMQDPGCSNPDDNNEQDNQLPQCSDNIDNDADGKIDFPTDPGCTSAQDNSEADTAVNVDLSIVKTSQQSTVVRGGQIVYTITVTNNGTAQATNVVVNDPIQSGLQFVSSAGASCAQNTATNVACTLGTMAAGSTRTFTLTFNVPTVAACTTTTIYNQATVSSSEGDSNQSNNTSANVAVTATCGDTQTGCIEVVKETFDANNNPIYTVPSFTFTLDGNRTAQNNSNGRARFDNVTAGTHTVIESVAQGWTLQSVTPNNGTVNVTAGGSCAQVLFRNRQNTGGGNTNDFNLTITDGESEVEPEDDLTYTITVRNNQNVSVSNATLTVTLSDEVNFDDCDHNCTENGRFITWPNISFNAGEQKTFEIDVEVDEDADGELRTTAQIGSRTATDSTDVEDDDVDSDNDDDEAAIDLIKEASTSEVFPGGVVSYTLRVSNTGDTELEDITVLDRLPSGVTIIDDGNADKRNGNQLTWEIDRLRKGEVWTRSYRVSIDAGLIPGTILRNDVRVTTDDDEIDENEGVTVSVIGNLPQTGFRGPTASALKLKPMHRNTSGSSALPLAAVISMMGLGMGAGLGLGRKYFMGL